MEKGAKEEAREARSTYWCLLDGVFVYLGLIPQEQKREMVPPEERTGQGEKKGEEKQQALQGRTMANRKKS